MLDRAENLLHDHYGGREYWDVSTSQRPQRVFSSENLTNRQQQLSILLAETMGCAQWAFSTPQREVCFHCRACCGVE